VRLDSRGYFICQRVSESGGFQDGRRGRHLGQGNGHFFCDTVRADRALGMATTGKRVAGIPLDLPMWLEVNGRRFPRTAQAVP